MQKVVSSNIAEVGYDKDTAELYIKFVRKNPKDKTVYRYKGVSPQRFQAFMDAESKGQYFQRAIKPSYPFDRVSEDVLLA